MNIIQGQQNDIIASINESITAIPFVFEGRIEAVEIFAGDENGNKLPESMAKWAGEVAYFDDENGRSAPAFSSATITVCRKFKGNLPTQIIILTRAENVTAYLQRGPGGKTEYAYINAQSAHADGYPVLLPHPSYPLTKLFFCSLTEWRHNPGKYSMESALEAPMYITAAKPKSDGSSEQVFATAVIYPHILESESDLHDFLSKIRSIDTGAKSTCQIPKKKEQSIEEVAETKVGADAEIWKRIIESRSEQIFANSSQRKSSAVINLNVSVANERIISIGSDRWLEFDVLVDANGGTNYLDNLLLRMSYNTSVFGSNIVNGNNVTVSNGPNFSSSTYVNVSSVIYDQSSNVITFPLNVDNNAMPLARTQISSVPDICFTVRMKIQTCSLPMNLLVTDQIFTASLCWYTTAMNSSGPSGAMYDNVSYSGNISDNACVPIITAFTNNTPAGIGRVVTIDGKYFGASRGTMGAVHFKNADRGDRYPVVTGQNNGGVQNYDIISWAHDEIKIRLPGFIDSAWVLNGNTPVGPTQVAVGSGKIRVRNFTGVMGESATPITIPWLIRQYPHWTSLLPYKKHNAKLVGLNGNGYKVQVNPNVVNAFGNNIRLVIKKAMREWTCATGINWYLGADTSISVNKDLLCIVDTLVTASGSLMRTVLDPRICIEAGQQIMYLRSFDLQIKTNPTSGTWFTDTINNVPSSNLDFFSAVSHEFGHAHQVGHINDSIVDLMWWQLGNSFTPFNNRKLVKWSPNARTGGEWVTDSLVPTLTCVGSHVLTYPTNCEGMIAVGMSDNHTGSMLVYPNPNNGSFKFGIDVGGEYLVYDITGNLVRSGLISTDTSIENLSPGFYVVSLNTGTHRYVQRVIVRN